jgi:NAD(P)-dependent dehydrogenase (short-subunit alcohol dehydrogenase family)
MLDLNDRVILISGANRGIGQAIAAVLYARGCRLNLGLRQPGSVDDFIASRDRSRLHIGRYEASEWASHAAWVGETAHALAASTDWSTMRVSALPCRSAMPMKLHSTESGLSTARHR